MLCHHILRGYIEEDISSPLPEIADSKVPITLLPVIRSSAVR